MDIFLNLPIFSALIFFFLKLKKLHFYYLSLLITIIYIIYSFFYIFKIGNFHFLENELHVTNIIFLKLWQKPK